MSFILDALKKLEEKRHNETAPDLMTIHTESRSKQVKRPLLAYLLVAVLLLNAVVLAAWLRPQQEESNSFTAQAEIENIENPIPAAPMNDDDAAKKDTLAVQEVVEAAPEPDIVVTESQDTPSIEIASLPINPSPDEIRALKSMIAEEQLLVNTSPSLEPSLEEESAADAERTVLNMSQLPLSIREGLPDLTITGHIYSNDPMSRLVNINGSLIREGGTVTTGLKVNEITISGVVLDYKGTLFSVRAF